MPPFPPPGKTAALGGIVLELMSDYFGVVRLDNLSSVASHVENVAIHCLFYVLVHPFRGREIAIVHFPNRDAAFFALVAIF